MYGHIYLLHLPISKTSTSNHVDGKYTDPIVPFGIWPWQTEDLALVPLDAPLNFIRGSHLVRLLVAEGMEELHVGVDPKSHLFFRMAFRGMIETQIKLCCCSSRVVRWLPSRKLTYPPDKPYLKMIFLFHRWDMLVPWRVTYLIYRIPGFLSLFWVGWVIIPQGVESKILFGWFAENLMNWNTWAENTSPPKPY